MRVRFSLPALRFMKNKVLVIVGPTASGKSSLAVKLAKKFDGEVISADSRQVYKGLNIGTGKITKKEMWGVPHHLIDVASPNKQFSVSDFLILTNQAIAKIVNKRKLPIVVGGTGFYINALAGAVAFPDVPPNKKLRERLNKKSALELFKILKEKDPKRAKIIDPNNKVRLIRALEIVEKIGHVPQLGSWTSKYHFVFVGMRAKNLNEKIYRRLVKRLGPMIREGKKLHAQGLTYKRMHELGLEYRYMAKFLKGQMTKNQTTNELFKEIKKYAKRQMTWFKRNKKIKWFKPDEFETIIQYANKNLGRDE